MIQNLLPRFHEAGKIKIGRAGEERTAQGGRKYRRPEKLNHFIVTTLERGADGAFTLDPIMQALGPKPTAIPVRLIFDSIEESFDNSYAVFIGGKCICRGDGIQAERRETTRAKGGPLRLTGEVKQVECGQACPHYRYRTGEPAKAFGAGKCKPYGILRVVLEGAQEVGGVYVFRTTSLNTIQSIRTSLAYIQMQTAGILAGLPLKLIFSKRQTTTADGTRTTIPVVNIAFAGSQQDLRQKALEVAKLRTACQLEMSDMRRSLKLISMRDTPEDERAVNAEFHPDTIDVQVIEETPSPTATPEEVAALMDGETDDAPDPESPEPPSALSAGSHSFKREAPAPESGPEPEPDPTPEPEASEQPPEPTPEAPKPTRRASKSKRADVMF